MQAPKLLWQPPDHVKSNSNLTHYINWLKQHNISDPNDYDELWEWSVNNIEDFWGSIWNYFSVLSTNNPTEVLSTHTMPKTTWFKGAQVNYTEHIFRNKTGKYPALLFKNESTDLIEISWAELEQKVASLKQYLELKGVKQGDRVAAYLPNIPEAIIAFLATNAIGAVWSSTSPDFGISSVVDRFSQIEPKVLITVDGYCYGGKPFDRTNEIEQIIEQLPTLQEVVLIPYLNSSRTLKFTNTTHWKDAVSDKNSQLSFNRVEFNEPIWVLYSSGTTGKPKAITHSVGGVLLEHLKYLTFHNNVKPGERCFCLVHHHRLDDVELHASFIAMWCHYRTLRWQPCLPNNGYHVAFY